MATTLPAGLQTRGVVTLSITIPATRSQKSSMLCPRSGITTTSPMPRHAVFTPTTSLSSSATIDEIHKDLTAIREGNGLAHAVLYGDDSTQHVMTNLNAISDDVRAIVSGVRQGKGTIGALLVDPTIYEDLRSAIGNVERNEVLRALVRYSIKADEQHPAPKVEPQH